MRGVLALWLVILGGVALQRDQIEVMYAQNTPTPALLVPPTIRGHQVRYRWGPPPGYEDTTPHPKDARSSHSSQVSPDGPAYMTLMTPASLAVPARLG